MDKNKTIAGRHALQEAAAQFRMEAAHTADARAEASSDWDCVRGHAWDDSTGVAQNVRCMNCAAQRRELQMARLEAVAEARGGRLLSANYVDATTPLRWQCAFGHEWQARADVASRRWCEQCVRCGMYDDALPHRAKEPEREVLLQSQPQPQLAGDGC
jgi:hypothetical protein